MYNQDILRNRLAPLLQPLRTRLRDPAVNRRLARLALLLTIVIFAWQAAGLTWTALIPPPPLPRPAPDSPARSPARPAAPPGPLIVSAHLFGEAGAKPVKVQGPIEAPETRLRLILRGVFASDDASLAMAIIAEKSGQDKTYRRGDRLPGGAVLHAIYSDRVILSRQGKLETLKLRRPRGKQDATITPAPAAAAPRSGPPIVRRVPQLQQVKRLYRDDPQALMRVIRITPVMQDGRLIGYRFQHKDRALMRAAGLQPQDVITRINGISVQEPSAMFALLQELETLQELQLEIRRGGLTRHLTLKLN